MNRNHKTVSSSPPSGEDRAAEKRFFRILGEIDASLIEEADSASSIRRLSPLRVWIPAAACLALCAAAGGIALFQQSALVLPQKEASSNMAAVVADAASEATAGSPQEEIHVPESTPAVSQDSSENNTIFYSFPSSSAALEDSSKARLESVTLNGSIFYPVSPDSSVLLDASCLGDVIENSEEEKQEEMFEFQGQSLREIKGIDPLCAIAVQTKDSSDYTAYLNPFFSFDTLGDLITKLNLRENLSFGTVWDTAGGADTETSYTLSDFSALWDLLLSNESALNLGNVACSGTLSGMRIELNTQPFNLPDSFLIVTEDGYLYTNLFWSGKSFFVGPDATQSFFESVYENGVISTTE